LIGVYLQSKELKFIYNKKTYKFASNEIEFENNILNNEQRKFIVRINEGEVCNIKYNRVKFIFSLGEEEKEFDYLLYLSKLFKSKEDIERFRLAMEKLGEKNI